MDKDKIVKSKNQLQVYNERKVMQFTNCYPDLFVRMLCSFQSSEHLFLVMEYVPVRPFAPSLRHLKGGFLHVISLCSSLFFCFS